GGERMAVDIGPKIGIDGEAEFRKSLQNINQQLKTLGSEMNAVTSAFGDNADSEDALTAKSSVLTKQIEAQQKKIDELNKGLTASAEKYGENDTRTLKWQQAVNNANAELSSMKNQLGKTTTGIDENKAAIDSNSGSVSSWKDKLSALGSVLGIIGKTVATAVTGATAAVTAFAKTSIDAGMSFDTSMSQVAATMGTTVDSISELRDFAMEMGANTAFSAVQAADALNYMALAGYDSEESMSALPTVLNLAAAGALDLAEASDMVTDVQSALGLSMEESAELVDKMAKAASSSNTSVGQLGSAILTVGGTAKNLAGGTTELSTALGILADNGIKGAEGGTALRNIILSLSAPKLF
ncbi:MAG: phage tail tape measure protein, partial [Opitutales bacterium]|nr:phage tail tape measure protein [Opitutales bacterium]